MARASHSKPPPGPVRTGGQGRPEPDVRVASQTWRRHIDSHEAFSHDSIEHLSYDWSRVGNPDIAPKPPFKVYLPRNTDDVVRAIVETKQLGQRLRVRSKGHSSNDLVLEEGGAILLTQTMDRIISVDADHFTATVQGGAISALVDDHLAPMGLGLPVVGDHRDITVGGFLSVGGFSASSHRFGMFIDNVLSLVVVGWDGTVTECSATDNSDTFYSVLAGLGRHGVVTEVTLRVIEIDKYRTIWKNHQVHFTNLDDYIAGTKPIVEDPGDARVVRGVWAEFLVGRREVTIGQFSTYHETTQSAAHRVRNTASYGALHSIGLAAGNLPAKVDRVLKFASIGGVLRSPTYGSVKNIEFFTDKVVDSTVGDPARWFAVIAPLDAYEELFREQWALMKRYRDEYAAFTFLMAYVKSIRSPYLARYDGDRFCELVLYAGVDNDRITPEILEQLVEEIDDVVIKFDGYRYMHTPTTKNPEKLAKIDPNLRHAQRRAAAKEGSK